jgi:hypothetical protein
VDKNFNPCDHCSLPKEHRKSEVSLENDGDEDCYIWFEGCFWEDANGDGVLDKNWRNDDVSN